jgi:amino acid transporter
MFIDENTLIIIISAFAVLILLSLILSIAGLSNRKKAQNKPGAPSPAAKSDPAGTAYGGIPGEIIAVITAAIAAYSSSSNSQLVIRSIRRRTNWNTYR